jgi:hypothetical protein
MACSFLDAARATNSWDTIASFNNVGFTQQDSTLATATVGSSYARFSGCSGLVVTAGQYHTGSWAPGGVVKNIPTASTLFASYSLDLLSSSNVVVVSSPVLCAFWDTNTPQISFCASGTGQIQIYRYGTLLATSATSISLTGWNRLEFTVTINSTTGYAECRANGVSLVAFTGNTQYTTNASANQVAFSASANSPGQPGGYMTDFMVYTNTGAAPNTWLGDKRLYTQLPNANGTATAWTANWASYANSYSYVLGQQLLDGNGNVQQCTTPGTSPSSGTPTWSTTLGNTTAAGATFTCMGAPANYKAVNEPGTPDGDNSYLSDATAGDEEGFTFPALPNTATNIVGVGLASYARKDDAGTRSIRLEVKSGSTVVDNGTDFAMITSYQYQQAFFPVDPQTSSGWTLAGVNALEARIKTTA